MSAKQQAAQMSEEWLRNASLPDIKAAYESGALTDVLGADPAEHGQLTDEDLKTMTPEQIVTADADGRLNHLMGRPLPVPADGPLGVHHLARMSPEQVVAAQKAGRLAGVLGGTAPEHPTGQPSDTAA
jgi:hypothetical protein